MDKRERAERAKQEEAAMNRVLIWIGGSVVLEALLLLLNRYYINYQVKDIEIAMALRNVFGVLAVVLPVCFLGCLAWWMVSWKRGPRRVMPQVLTTITGVLAACALIVRFYDKTGIKALYVGVPCLAVLALIYYLYQREFFIMSLMGGAGLLGLWLLNRRAAHPLEVYGYLAVEIAFLVAVAVCSHLLQERGGVFQRGEKRMVLLPKDANYTMLYATCLVVALIQVIALVMGPMMLLYGVLIVWLLAMAVYYTVKLM
ncbi:MAG: hypothetical protein KH704_12105 [Clostridiales bacterium]|nr:hypothetical protein [Clostridiales bacterium]